jgi:transposase InsO family protein
VRFAFIDEQRGHFPVELMCEVLGVTRSGYYAWRSRPASPRAHRQAELLQAIEAVHRESRGTYGSPRVHKSLQARGVACSLNTVAKLMQLAGVRACTARRFVVRTTDSRHEHPVAPNVLDRQFYPERPDAVWAGDITYIPTAEGGLYLAVVLDLFSRRVVGWATAEHLRSELVGEALQRALQQRQPRGPLLHHSDRGVQYAASDYQRLLAAHGLEVSMSRTGECYDTAVVESFFGTLKQELVHQERYKSRAAARRSLFEYIEVFYNRKRLHSTLGYRSPALFEAQFPYPQPSAH